MPNAITRDNLGAWLLKANPTLWDLTGLMQSGEQRLTSWAVQKGYRSALMRPGDRVLFWVSGDGRTGLVRGIWGDGEVTAPAEDWVDAEAGHWRDDRARQAVRARLSVRPPTAGRAAAGRGSHALTGWWIWRSSGFLRAPTHPGCR